MEHEMLRVETSVVTTEFVPQEKDEGCISSVDNALSQSVQNGSSKRKRKPKKSCSSDCPNNSIICDNMITDSVNDKNNESVLGDQNSAVAQMKNISSNLVNKLAPAIDSDSFEKEDYASLKSEILKSKENYINILSASLEENASFTLQDGQNSTNGIGSSATNVKDSGMMNKESEKASLSDCLTSVAVEGGSPKDTDAGTSENIPCSEDVMEPTDLESNQPRKKRKKVKKCTSSDTNDEEVRKCPENILKSNKLEKSKQKKTREKLGKNTSSDTNVEEIKNDPSTAMELNEEIKNDPSTAVEINDLSSLAESKVLSSKLGTESPSESLVTREEIKKKEKKLTTEENVTDREQKNEDDLLPVEALAEETIEGSSEDNCCINSSSGNNIKLQVAEENCCTGKGPSCSVEVKAPSNLLVTEGQSDQSEVTNVENVISEEKATDIAVEQKKEDTSVPLVVEETVPVLERSLAQPTKKKLLVLDLNGLLCDVVHTSHYARNPHKIIGRSSVFRRPYCNYFLKFCFERFVVGVWSSRRRENVEGIVNFILGDVRNLSFCWDVDKCTYTGYTTVEDENKPMVLKELKKLWNKEDPDLRWQPGEYSASNTLLIDDSPYKALCNPPHTGIFPKPYSYWDSRNDYSLGPNGDLKLYLERLAMADDVQEYVREHPFGRRAITPKNASWKYYEKVINKVQSEKSHTVDGTSVHTDDVSKCSSL